MTDEISIPKVKVVMKRSDVMRKYNGKPCVLARSYPCKVENCSLARCDRLQAYEEAGTTVSKPPNNWKGKSNDSARAIAAIDRLYRKKLP